MQRLILLAVSPFLFIPAAWGAEEGAEDYGSKSRNLQQEIMGIVLLKELVLSRPVARAVLTAAYDARQITETFKKKEGGLNVEFEKAIREFREEDYANKGLSKKVEGRAAALEHELKALRKAYCDSVNELEVRIDALLSPAQKDVVARFPRRFDVEALARYLRGQPLLPELPKPLKVELERLRGIPEKEWEAHRAEIVERWVSRFEKSRRPFPSEDARLRYVVQLGDLFRDVRGMSDEEFEGSDGAILERLRPVGRADALERELKDINKDHYGGMGRIGAFLCAPRTIALLSGEDCVYDGEAEGDPAVIKQIRVEINALNLMNGLHLSAEQVEAFLEGAKTHGRLRSECLGEGGKGEPSGSKEEYEALLALKERLEKGEKADPAFLKDLKILADKAPRRKRAAFKPDKKRYHRELRALEKKIAGLLLPSQIDVISTYKPCLIPPKNLKDPVRVGQASDHSRAGKTLERLRKLSQSRWDKLGRAMMEKSLEAWEERHGRFPAGEREAEIERAMKVVEEARALTEVDFQMRKDDLAKMVEFTDRKEELQQELKAIVHEKADPPGTIAHTLLDPRIIPVLERRLRQLKGFEPGAPVDLDRIKGTDAKKGKCGTTYDD